MQRHGWVLLFHGCIVDQLQRLQAAAARAERNDPKGFERNANVKLFRALSQLILETIPSNPARDEYRQGNTLGRPIGIGDARRSDYGSPCSSATIPEPRSLSLPGSMTSRRSGRRPASPPREPYLG